MVEWKKYGDYEVSNTGLVKGKNGKLLKGGLSYGYKRLCLRVDNKNKMMMVHHLVWDLFGDKERDGRKIQVDHINNDKQNNCISNLQLLSPRENKVKERSLKYDYIGTYYEKKLNKWRSRIYINGETKYIGLYNTQIEAHDAYKKELRNYE